MLNTLYINKNENYNELSGSVCVIHKDENIKK